MSFFFDTPPNDDDEDDYDLIRKDNIEDHHQFTFPARRIKDNMRWETICDGRLTEKSPNFVVKSKVLREAVGQEN